MFLISQQISVSQSHFRRLGQNIGEVSNLLFSAVFEYFNFFRFEIRDRFAALIGNDGIYLDQIRRNTDERLQVPVAGDAVEVQRVVSGLLSVAEQTMR